MSGKSKRPSMANAVGNVAVMAQTNAGTDARMVQVSTISVIQTQPTLQPDGRDAGAHGK